MANPYRRDKIENWVGDFCFSDVIGRLAVPPALKESASSVLTAFLDQACRWRDREPENLEQADVKAGLLRGASLVRLPAGIREAVPDLCGAFLAQLETQGRLSGGRALGELVSRVLRAEFIGGLKPIVHKGLMTGLNDPCPCGSGKKYKKCCKR
jgi:hypothetical protein